MRTITTIQVDWTPEVVRQEIGKIMLDNGYKLQKFDNEDIFKKGDGWLTGPKFFKFVMSGDKLSIETWIKFAIFPFVFVGELGIKGSFGFLPKLGMRKILQEIVQKAIRQGTQIEGYYP